LHGEVQALNTGSSQVVAFYGPKEYALLKDEVEKLAEGIFDERAEQFISGRKQFSESARSGRTGAPDDVPGRDRRRRLKPSSFVTRTESTMRKRCWSIP